MGYFSIFAKNSLINSFKLTIFNDAVKYPLTNGFIVLPSNTSIPALLKNKKVIWIKNPIKVKNKSLVKVISLNLTKQIKVIKDTKKGAQNFKKLKLGRYVHLQSGEYGAGPNKKGLKLIEIRTSRKMVKRKTKFKDFDLFTDNL